MSKERIAVLGGGSWATALVKLLQEGGNQVTWWMRDTAQADGIRETGSNPKYISSVSFDLNRLTVSTDLISVLDDAHWVILAVPAAFLEAALEELPISAFKEKVVISAVKGMIPGRNEVIADYLLNCFDFNIEQLLVIAGPCHAEEVALKKLSYLTIAGIDTDASAQFAKMISCKYLKSCTSEDVYGTEYAAVLKNIYALACGIARGIGYGDNFQAVLVSASSREMKRITDALHPLERDIKESAYLGDLLVTAYSQFSRNRTFGHMIGRGYTVQSARMEMGMVAEGYFATKPVHELCEASGVSAPIVEAVYKSLYLNVSPSKAFAALSEKLR